MTVSDLWVKLCGITQAEDAHCAHRAGVDAVGLVFVPQSPRSLTLDQAKALDQRMDDGLERVGLFMDAPSDWVAAVLDTIRLDRLQFHGSESANECERYGMPYIKALGFADVAGASADDRPMRQAQWLARAHQYRQADALLIDSHGSGQMGGSGETSDWQALSYTARQLDRPWILAGGLRPDNVAQALIEVDPHGIDLSSGVETQPGIKDHGKINELMRSLERVASHQDRTSDDG